MEDCLAALRQEVDRLDDQIAELFLKLSLIHIYFAMFGAFSGFDTVEECFGDLADQIHGVETGLSSDCLLYTSRCV